MMRTLGSLILAAGLAGACAAPTGPDAPSQTAPPPRASGPPSRGVTASDGPTVGPSGEPASTPSAEPSTGPSDRAVAVLDVQCGTGGPVLASPAVRMSPRGVRFKVTGQKGWEFGIDHALGHESVALDA